MRFIPSTFSVTSSLVSLVKALMRHFVSLTNQFDTVIVSQRHAEHKSKKCWYTEKHHAASGEKE